MQNICIIKLYYLVNMNQSFQVELVIMGIFTKFIMSILVISFDIYFINKNEKCIALI